MDRPTLPAPDGDGIYTFPDDLQAAHHKHLRRLAARRAAGDTAILELTAPHTDARYPIARRVPYGRPLVVIEPHHDDLALSAAGCLLAQPRPVTVITVFTRSTTVDAALRGRYPTEQAVSELRASESWQALRPLQARQHLLGHRDAVAPYHPYDPAILEQVTDELQELIAGCGDAELIAPAAVTRHPDHLLVHQAARRVGCRLFWDDVAFWPTYALSADDRCLFELRTRGELISELIDITGVVLDKLTLLHMHASQVDLAQMYRPIRYAWTVATGLPRAQDPPEGHRFAERFYRLAAS